MSDYLQSQQPESTLLNEEIAELEAPVVTILRQLKERIGSGSYSLIIGDDASGRIPALLFGKILNGVYNKRGDKKAEVIFLAGSTDIFDKQILSVKTADIKAFLEKAFLTLRLNGELSNHSKRILIATESISHGTSLAALAKALQELNVQYDIASVGFNQEDPAERKAIEDKLGAQIFFGQTRNPSIVYKYNLSGVKKEANELHSFPAKRKDFKIKQDSINAARQDIDLLAKSITEQLF